MKKLLLTLLLTAVAFPQAGTKSTNAILKVPAGSLLCTFTNSRPIALTGLHMDCTSSNSTLKQDLVIAIGSKSTGQFLAEKDSIQWTFQRDSVDGSLLYKVNANGKVESGSL